MATTNKGLDQPANGSNLNVWDVPLNTNFGILDAALGGVSSINAAADSGTTRSLTSAEYQKLILSISGVITGAVRYNVPSGVGGFWVVVNGTTGAFSLTIGSAGGGDTVVVTQGKRVLLYSDGTNVRVVSNEALPADSVSTSSIINLAVTNAKIADATIEYGKLATNLLATVAQWRSNTADKLLETDVVWSAMAEVTLTDGATVNWDMSTGFDFILTLGGTGRTMAAPTNPKVGQKGRLVISQDATGSRTITTWNSVFKFEQATIPTLSTAANAVDILYYDVRASNFIAITLSGRGFASQ